MTHFFFCHVQDAVNKAIPAVPTEAERPPIHTAMTSSSTSTPEEPGAVNFNPFSSAAGVASRPPLSTASIGQPPIPIQQGEPSSPPILIDDSPTIAGPFSSKFRLQGVSFGAVIIWRPD